MDMHILSTEEDLYLYNTPNKTTMPFNVKMLKCPLACLKGSQDTWLIQ